MMHKTAVAVGAIVIGATAHVNVMASGGYLTLSAPTQLGIALGLIIGAICIGIAWREHRHVIALCLVGALLAGEAFAVIMTAERTLSVRNIASAPLRDAEDARNKATRRVAVAAAALASLPARSPRLEAATAAKAAADAAVIEKSAERGCAVNCRTLLQQQVDNAQAEVAAARVALEANHASAQREIGEARAALAALPPPRSAAPLAEALGVAGWALDLLTAALASVAANGLGAALVAFGAHGRAQGHTVPAKAAATATPAEPVAAAPAPLKALPAPAREHAARFGLDMLRPAPGSVPVVRLHGAYRDWCTANGLAPLPAREIATALDDLFARSGLDVQEIDGAAHLIGARLKAAPRQALSKMATAGARA